MFLRGIVSSSWKVRTLTSMCIAKFVTFWEFQEFPQFSPISRKKSGRKCVWTVLLHWDVKKRCRSLSSPLHLFLLAIIGDQRWARDLKCHWVPRFFFSFLVGNYSSKSFYDAPWHSPEFLATRAKEVWQFKALLFKLLEHWLTNFLMNLCL